MQLNLARKGNGLNGGWHKSAIATLLKGVFDKGRCWKDDKPGNCLPQLVNSHCPKMGRWYLRICFCTHVVSLWEDIVSFVCP